MQHLWSVSVGTPIPLIIPLFFARNGGGDYYTSDGNILMISYTQAPMPPHQPALVIEGLKTGSFLVFDAMMGMVGPITPLLALIFSLIAGVAIWRITDRNRSLIKTKEISER